ncbi:MAG: thymidine phosphorylase family protein [Nanoarchaeota archaeon]
MKLKIRELAFDSDKILALIRQDAAKVLAVHTGDRIIISHKGKKIVSEVDITHQFLREGEISISKEALEYLNAFQNEEVKIFSMPHPASLDPILKKLNGEVLTKDEIHSIVVDIVNNTLTEAEIAYFVSGVYKNGMTLAETINLTEAIYKTGQVLHWSSNKIADKHSIGGIAGNRTTPIVVSISAAAGIIMPKTSSRVITSAAGTADIIETIAKIDFPAKELQRIVNKTGACLAWGGSLGLAPADDKLIRVERLLDVDPEAQLIASIIAKKLAVGSKYVLIDIPYGKDAKVTKAKAEDLKKKFLLVGKHFNINLKIMLTDGSQPIGNGIGPVLEMRDVLKVLKRDNPPKDLERKSVMLAGIILEMLGKSKKGEGANLAMQILNSGKALKKFNEIIDAQGRKKDNLNLARYKKDIKSKRSGKIKSINNKTINHLAKLLGCPVDKSSGIYLYKHTNFPISKNEKILTFYSESKSKLQEALKFYNSSKPISIISLSKPI